MKSLSPIRIQRSWLSTAAVVLLSLTLVACDSGFEPGPANLPLSEDPDFTGGRTEDGRPLTAASDDGEVQGLKDRIPPGDGDNFLLAKSIASFDLKLSDPTGKVVDKHPDFLRIEIRMKSGYSVETELDFKVPLRTGPTGGILFRNVKSQQTPDFAVSGVCADVHCAKVVLRLKHQSRASKGIPGRQAEAGLVYRRREASVQSRVGAGADAALSFTTKLKELHRVYQATRPATFSTIEVAWGLAAYSVRLENLCVSGRLVQTNESDEALTIGCGGTGVSGVLVGNNNIGGIIVRLRERESELYVKILAPADARVNVDDILPPPVSSGPILTGGVRLPADPNHPVTRVWERDRNNKDVLAAIKHWAERSEERTKKFLARIQPNLPVMTKALQKSDVPSEFIAITMIESRFFVDDGYPIEVASSSTATGPWQFLNDTAKWLGLRIRPHQGKRADPCDERALLGPSTEAAGRYFRALLDEFPSDPKLAVMSYYWGQENVGNAVACLKKADCVKRRMGSGNAQRFDEIKHSGFDFWGVKAFNMAPASATDYVVKFMAAQFVGREPERYAVKPYDPRDLGTTRPARSTCQ